MVESFSEFRQTFNGYHPPIRTWEMQACAIFDLQTGTARNFDGGSLMKNIAVVFLFMLATVAWAAAQQPQSPPDRSNGSAGSTSRTPGAGQSSGSTTGAGQDQSGGQTSNAPVTEGCLGGSNPNYTVTDKTGTTYKLNIPANADASKLASHIGEPVQVLGDVKGGGKTNASIDVQGVGKGTGTCPGSGSSPAQTPPKP